MSHYEFNEMMTATIRKESKEYKPYEKFMSKRDFLNQYYEQLPDRNRRAMTRFRERHFQNVEKTEWTAEDDEELERLVKDLGNKWVEIAQMMGRTQDFIHQRWRHKLNYGKQRVSGDWTLDELNKLEQEVLALARRQGKDPDESDLDIKWNVVSERLGSGRTAQQCSNRWRINTHTRKGTKFVRVPHADRIPNVKKGPRTPSKMDKRLTPKKASVKKATKKSAEKTPGKKRPKQRGDFKSAEYVKDSDNEGDEVAADDVEDPEVTTSEDQEEASNQSDGSEGSSSDHTHAEQDDQDDEATDRDEAGNEQNTQGEEVMAMIEEKMGDETDDEGSGESTNVSKSDPDTTGVDTSSPPQSQPRKHGRLLKSSQQQSSQIPASSQAAKTPAVSKNPFNTKTPSNALSMTQLHNGTQATSSVRPTTRRMSRVPETEERPDRPSPAISMRQRPISSPLDMLAQVAIDEDEREIEETDHEEGNDTRDTLKSPNSFVSAKSVRNKESDSDESEETEESSRSRTESESGSDETDDSASTSDTDDASDEDSQEEQEAEQGQGQKSSQNSFWKSVNNLRNIIPGLSQPTTSQAQGQKGKKRNALIDSLSRPPVDDSSDDE